MRFAVLAVMIIAGAVFAGIYGALYDQLTFSISPEFFVKYRFIQSQFHSEASMNPRVGAALIGFINTWKAGLFLGIILSLTGMITKDHKRMLKITLNAFLITLAIAFIAGLTGWAVGALPGQEDPDVSLGIVDVNAFKTVVNMTNFSYAGAVIGMFFGIFYQVYSHKKLKQQQVDLS